MKGHFTDQFGVFWRVLFCGLGGFGFYGLESGVFVGVEDAFGGSELASFLCFAHFCVNGFVFEGLRKKE